MRDEVVGQRRLVIGSRRDLALGRSMLSENPVGPSLGHAQFSNHVLHAGPAECGV